MGCTLSGTLSSSAPKNMTLQAYYSRRRTCEKSFFRRLNKLAMHHRLHSKITPVESRISSISGISFRHSSWKYDQDNTAHWLGMRTNDRDDNEAGNIDPLHVRRRGYSISRSYRQEANRVYGCRRTSARSHGTMDSAAAVPIDYCRSNCSF